MLARTWFRISLALALAVFALLPALAEDFFLRRNVGGIVPADPPPVWVTGASLGNFTPGQGLNFTLLAEDPKGQTVSYELGEGSSLPGSLSLDGDHITGPAPAEGTYQFTILAVDSTSHKTGQLFTLSTNDGPVFSGGNDLGDFAAGGSVSANVTATDSDGIASYAILGDAHGLSISNGGALSGTAPAAGGAYSITVRATDTLNNSTERSYDFYANRAPYFTAPAGTDIGTYLTMQNFTVNLTVVDDDGDDITLISVNKPSPSASWKYNGQTGNVTVSSGSTVTLSGYTQTVGSGLVLRDRLNDGRGLSNSQTTRDLTFTARRPVSCKELHDADGTLSSGAYTIDPDGAGGTAEFQVYCDMTTSGGGWTLVWRYGFNNYASFSDPSNAVTPVPAWPATVTMPVSSTAPLGNDDNDFSANRGALAYSLWSAISATEWMVRSNIDDWYVCNTPSLIQNVATAATYPSSSPLTCTKVQEIHNAACADTAPTGLGLHTYGPMLTTSGSLFNYYWDGNGSANWPTHDPCGTNATNQKTGVANPGGSIWLR